MCLRFNKNCNEYPLESAWSSWSVCHLKDGRDIKNNKLNDCPTVTGEKFRTRTCLYDNLNIDPNFNYGYALGQMKICQGPFIEYAMCHVDCLQKDGEREAKENEKMVLPDFFENCYKWTECEKNSNMASYPSNCGNYLGNQFKVCSEHHKLTKPCQLKSSSSSSSCQVNGKFGEWSKWDFPSQSAKHVKLRKRSCNFPKPHGVNATICQGHTLEAAYDNNFINQLKIEAEDQVVLSGDINSNKEISEFPLFTDYSVLFLELDAMIIRAENSVILSYGLNAEPMSEDDDGKKDRIIQNDDDNSCLKIHGFYLVANFINDDNDAYSHSGTGKVNDEGSIDLVINSKTVLVRVLLNLAEEVESHSPWKKNLKKMA